MKLFFLLLPLFALAGCGPATPDANTQANTAASDKKSAFGRSMDKAKKTDATQNIASINMALMMVKDSNDGQAPADLAAAKAACKLPDEVWIDDVTGQPLKYDPQTGTVSR